MFWILVLVAVAVVVYFVTKKGSSGSGSVTPAGEDTNYGTDNSVSNVVSTNDVPKNDTTGVSGNTTSGNTQ